MYFGYVRKVLFDEDLGSFVVEQFHPYHTEEEAVACATEFTNDIVFRAHLVPDNYI